MGATHPEPEQPCTGPPTAADIMARAEQRATVLSQIDGEEQFVLLLDAEQPTRLELCQIDGDIESMMGLVLNNMHPSQPFELDNPPRMRLAEVPWEQLTAYAAPLRRPVVNAATQTFFDHIFSKATERSFQLCRHSRLIIGSSRPGHTLSGVEARALASLANGLVLSIVKYG